VKKSEKLPERRNVYHANLSISTFYLPTRLFVR